MNTSNSPAPAQMPHLFKSPQASWVFVFPNGKRAVFVRGMYTTSDPKEIAHLNHEIELGHPAIFVDPEEVLISLDRIDPVAALKGKLRLELLEELQAEMLRSTNPDNDMGKSEQGKFRPASTTDIAPVTAGGDASERMAKIKAGVAALTTKTTIVEQTKPAAIKIPEVPADSE